MKIPLIVFFSLLFVDIGLCNDIDKAINSTAKAFSKTKTAKKISKKTERAIEKTIPINKKIALTLGTTVMVFVDRKINTNDFSDLKFDLFGKKAKANLECNFDKEEQNAFFKLSWNL